EEDWMKYPVENWLGMTWGDYVSSPKADYYIQSGVQWMGVFYALLAMLVLLYPRFKKLTNPLLWIATGMLFFLALCYLKVAFFSLGQLFEYTLQFSSFAFLIYAFKGYLLKARFTFLLKIVIALTFTCHGLYAVGYYPVPGKFVQMVISILGVNNEQAFLFLKTAAIMDFAVAIGIFLPGKWQVYFLGYAVFWGFSTSIARIWSNFYIEMWQESISHWLPETIFRFPHFLGPLAAIGIYFLKKEIKPAPKLEKG
ncbi:MAG: hypothetical protein KDC24_13205, partial [Saprospiraceae bacterium]|nr:hypothetical protein [Saprospiraceae bacterium]